MTPSFKFKSQVEKIFWITIFWVVISMLQFFNNYSNILRFKCDLSGTSLTSLFKMSLLTGLVAGLIGGSVIVFYWAKWLRTKSYGRSLFNIFLSFTIVYLAVTSLAGSYFQASQLNVPIFHIETWKAYGNNFISFIEIQNYLYWLLIVLFTLIALLVNDKYGPGVFVSFLRGKYFLPKREERIFMFLDLRKSTTIAEQLGEDQYFHFLKDVFRDATPGIINSKGEIYQYVGDEIVISWNKDSGIKNANCLQCFFEIQQCLLDKADYYREAYDGQVPVFKAGLHYGFVMVGEIGIVKRDIAYSGDVLNTTARIQSKCNEFGVDLLISKYLLDKLEVYLNLFTPKSMGDISLRGKKETVRLYTV